VAILGMTVTRVRAANGGHAQLTLRRVRDVLDGIAFDRGDLAESVTEGDRVDVVGRLVSRRFGGFETLQIEIRDVSASGHHAEAAAILALEGDGAAEPALAGGRA
jgi:single-stranded-DNA-specific exonuclease